MTTGISSIADVLTALGVDVRRDTGSEVIGCCPVHEKRTGKADRSPSWSINIGSGLWICHSCGARGNLPQLVAEITGSYESVFTIYNLMLNSGMDQLTNPKVYKKEAIVDWEKYMSFCSPPESQLSKRGIALAQAERHGIRWDTYRESWIIPIISPSGELMGWQEKSSTGVLNFPTGVAKSEVLFGLDVFNSNTAILVESPLDVVRFASAFEGVQCLASFGVNISKKQIKLLSGCCDNLIVALDNDKAGITVGKELMKSLPPFRQGIQWLYYKHTKAKDIGEMSNEDLQIAVKHANSLPWWLL